MTVLVHVRNRGLQETESGARSIVAPPRTGPEGEGAPTRRHVIEGGVHADGTSRPRPAPHWHCALVLCIGIVHCALKL